jgi:DNA polymerase I-like protein with 3'-5' exonuclease and polymerase domains
MNIYTKITELPLSISGDTLAFDIETSGLEPRKDKVLIIAVSNGTDDYIVDCTKGINVTRAFKWVAYVSKGKTLLGHNLTFDMKFAFHYGVTFDCTLHDTMLTEQLLTAGLLVPQGFNLKAVASKYCNITLEKDTRNEFIDNPDITLEQRHFDYAIGDVHYLYPIYAAQLEKVHKFNLTRVYELEMQLLPVVVSMEYAGIALDATKLQSLVPIFDKLVNDAYMALQDLFISNGACDHILFDAQGYSAVNLNSKPTKARGSDEYRLGQVYDAFARIGITPTDKRGNPTLSAKYIMQWDMKNTQGITYNYADELDISDDEFITAITAFDSLKHPVLRAYTYYIAATKLRDSYVIGTLERYDEATQRYYGWFKQLGARATGRFSSNTQQIPNDTRLKALSVKHSIRECFVAPEGKSLLISDFAGIELVILADVSDDDVLGNLIVASAEGKDDMHLYVVRQAFTDLYPDAINATLANKNKPEFKTLRNASKPTSYGIAYGITGMALSDTLSMHLAPLHVTCSVEQAQTILDNWKYKAFVKAGKWLDNAGKSALVHGYSQTRLGRRRWFDLEFAKLHPWRKHAIAREASNAPIQGACADIVKLAMIKIHKELDAAYAKIILTVHDELLIECDTRHIEHASAIMKWGMESAAQELLPNMGKNVKVAVNVSDRYNK